jgi:hypothetical protein
MLNILTVISRSVKKVNIGFSDCDIHELTSKHDDTGNTAAECNDENDSGQPFPCSDDESAGNRT